VDIISYYNKLLKKNKNSPQSVGWGSKKSQNIRFKILAEIGDLKGKKILDYGCGTGELCQFLKKYKIGEYVGYDINNEMIDVALKKYPKEIFRSYLNLMLYDYIFISGTFNLKTKNWEKETYKILRKLWGICRKGIAVNFLTSFSSYKDKKCYYADPIEILKFVRTLTNKFVLRHDYKENDFTIYLYK